MPLIAYTQQVFNRDKYKKLIATDLKTSYESSLRTVEISFYDHEIYAGEKLIACITHDHDDFVTQRWVVMINDVEIHRANTWAKCYEYIAWHYKQGTLPTQQQEETAAIDNEETTQVEITQKLEFDSCEDIVYCNWVKLGEVGCTGNRWVVRASPQNQLKVPFNKAFSVVWSLSVVEVSPIEANGSINIPDTNISKNCEDLLDKPFDQLIHEEWERLRKYKPLARKTKTAAGRLNR